MKRESRHVRYLCVLCCEKLHGEHIARSTQHTPHTAHAHSLYTLHAHSPCGRRWPFLTCRETVEFADRLFGCSGTDVDTLLASLGLQSCGNTLVHYLLHLCHHRSLFVSVCFTLLVKPASLLHLVMTMLTPPPLVSCFLPQIIKVTFSFACGLD